MDIGIALPHMGAEASPALITSFAQEAERLGYASLWAGERLLRPRHFVAYGHPSNPTPEHFKNVYDPLETLSYIAAKTERIKLGTSVINAFFHVPVVLGRRFATLDQFSQGRVIAGIGQGWMKDEFDTANVPWQRRGNGFEDYIAALRAVWGPDPVEYEGRHYRIIESDIGPKPLQPHGPPLLLGTSTPALLERAARLADGINPVARSWDALEQIAHEFPERVQQAGRNPQAMQIIVRSNGQISASPLPESRPPLSGSLEQIREDIQRLAGLEITHVFFDFVATPVNDQMSMLEKLRRATEI
ncbi:MAG: TIGR03619 family F420-dependent LLM class oxidoreductase [Ktedonobacteraceae bacterium]|nr:TIGR03619 family F420-dependent LLM class oxidoreductase [Ktedonobacteraceae bacterium]